MTLAQIYKCSAAAEETWRRLLCVYAFVTAAGYKDRRGNKVDVGGDAQVQGFDWAERALSASETPLDRDLGTEARIMYWDAESRLMLLEVRGPNQKAGVALARRKLGLQRVTDTREKYGLDWKTAEELIERVKEYLHWSLSYDDGTPEPEPEW